MEELFESFNMSVSLNNFAELSGGVFSWLEENCKPPVLHDIVINVLQRLNGPHQ